MTLRIVASPSRHPLPSHSYGTDTGNGGDAVSRPIVRVPAGMVSTADRPAESSNSGPRRWQMSSIAGHRIHCQRL